MKKTINIHENDIKFKTISSYKIFTKGKTVKETIDIHYNEKESIWVARYKTLDLVATGKTERKARENLLDIIITHIDFAVKNNNILGIFPQEVIDKIKIRNEC